MVLGLLLSSYAVIDTRTTHRRIAVRCVRSAATRPAAVLAVRAADDGNLLPTPPVGKSGKAKLKQNISVTLVASTIATIRRSSDPSLASLTIVD